MYSFLANIAFSMLLSIRFMRELISAFFLQDLFARFQPGLDVTEIILRPILHVYNTSSQTTVHYQKVGNTKVACCIFLKLTIEYKESRAFAA